MKKQQCQPINADKPGPRADGSSLLPSALRPGLSNGGTGKRAVFAALTTVLALGINFVAENTSTLAASITLTVPSKPLSLDIGRDGILEKTDPPAEVSVKTDSLAGYRLTISSKNDNKLKNDADELVSLPDSVITETKSGITEDEFSTNPAYINHWGYKPSKLNGNNNDFYIPGPTSTPTLINKTSGSNVSPDTYTFAIAAKTDSETQNGTYSNTFTLCADSTNHYKITYDVDGGDRGELPDPYQEGDVLGNSVQLSDKIPTKSTDDGDYEFKGWCSKKPDPSENNNDNPTCKGGLYQPGNELALCDGGNDVTLYAMWQESGKYMQNWKGCDELSEHETVELIDSRDNNTYTVSKLKDGKCWMVNNLRLGSNSTTTLLTSTDSDISSEYTLPRGSTSGFSNSNSAFYLDPSHGGFYSYLAATANSGNGLSSGNAPYSICPRGWRLPSVSEYTTMVNQYGGNTQQGTDNLQKQPVPGFTVGQGYYYADHLNPGTYGLYRSSTACGATYANYVEMTSSYANPAYCSQKAYGEHVRCIVR